MQKESLYDIIGVPFASDFEAIRKAYKDKMRTEHPDKKEDSDAYKIIEAYKLLSDPGKKLEYDQEYQSKFFIFSKNNFAIKINFFVKKTYSLITNQLLNFQPNCSHIP